MKRFDVAIVGAGPAGCSSAISLLRKGYSVLLVDKQVFPRDKLCGDFLNPTNWPLFERLGIANEILSLEHDKVTVFRITSFTGEEATVRFPRKPKNSFGLGLRRSYLDHLLLKTAENEGAIVEQGSRVKGLKRETDGWSIILGNHSTEETLHAAFLIGADGRNSWVARRLGLARLGENGREVLAFQLHMRGTIEVNGEVQIHILPEGYAGLVGLGGGMVNLCFTIEKERINKASSLEYLFESYLCKNPRLRESLREGEVLEKIRSIYPVYFLPRLSYGDRFLLVGDAARVTEPVTGEGIYFALRGGELAGEAIHSVFSQGEFSARCLSSYQHACQRVFFVRHRVNSIIRSLIYRPPVMTRLIRFSCKTSLPLRSLVNLLCGTG